MPKSDSLKNRLDELFSSETGIPYLPPEEATPEALPIVPVLEAPPVAPAQPVLDLTISAFQTAFEHNPFGMVMTSLDGHLIRVNDAFCQMLGYTPEELEGASFQSLTYAEDRPVGGEAMRLMLQGEAPTAHIQKRYVHKDGRLVWVDLNVALTRDQAGAPQFFVTNIQDLTAQRETAALLEKRVRELNCLNDIGHKIDEKPPLPEFFTWLTQRIPFAFRDPEHCVAAVEYGGQVYGPPDVLELKTKIVGGLRVAGELVGWLHVAYRETASIHDFIDAESALMGSIVSRVSSYLEGQRLLQQTQASLEQAQTSRQLLSTIVNSIPNPVFFKDAQGVYTGCNQAYLDFLGLSAKDVIGKGVYDLKIDRERADTFYKSDMQLFQKPGVQVYESTVPYSDGSLHQVIHNKATFNNPDGTLGGLVGVLVDITGQLGAQSQLQRQAEELAKVAEIATTVSTTLESGQLLQQVVDLVKNAFNLYHAHIYLLNQAGDTLELAAGADEVGRQMVRQGRNIALDSERSLVARAARQRTGVIVNDVRADPDFLPNPLLPETASEMAVPLVVGERLLGVLDVQSERTGRFMPSDVAIHTTLGSQVAVALQNARQYEEAHQSEQLIRAMIDNLPDSIFVKDARSRWILNNKAHLSMLGFESQEQVLGKSDLDIFPIEFAQKYFDDEQELISRREPLVNYEESVIHQTTGQMMDILTSKIPILNERGDVVAMVGINHDITDLKRIENLLARQATQLATVAQISTTITTIPDPTELLQSVVDLTTENFGIYHAHIYLLDEDGKNLDLAAGAFEVGRRMVAQGWKIGLESERSLVARAARERKGLIVGDVQSDPNFLPNEMLPKTRSEMVVPMLIGERLLGVLDLQDERVNHFIQQDADIMTTLATQVGIALQNARQYQATEASEKLVRTIIDATPDWIFIKDRQHRFRLVNKGFADSMHIPAEDFIGKDDLEIGFPEELVKGNPEKGISGFWADDQLVMEGGEPRYYPNDTAMVDGKLHIFNTFKTPLRDASGQVWGVLAFSRDVTEREALLAETGIQAQTLAVLNEMSRDLTATLDVDKIARITYEYTSRLMDTTNFFIAHYDEPTDMLSFPLVINENTLLSFAPEKLANNLTGYIISNRKPLLLSEYDEADVIALGIQSIGFGEDLPVLSWLGVPLLLGEQILGAIVVQSTQTPKLFTERHRDILAAVAAQAASALTLAEQYQSIEARARQERALREAASRVRASMNADTIMRTAVRELNEVLGRRAFIRLGSADEFSGLATPAAEVQGDGGAAEEGTS